MVEFNQSRYTGREASGVIIITLNLLGGTATVKFTANVSMSPVSATGTWLNLHNEVVMNR